MWIQKPNFRLVSDCLNETNWLQNLYGLFSKTGDDANAKFEFELVDIKVPHLISKLCTGFS